jgi:hypothetical protein
MKKIYLAILTTLAFTQISNAQLTLTKAANEPIIGDLEFRKRFDSTAALPNTPGANQTWNFTAITSNTAAATTSSYILPTSAPGYTSSYSSATVAKTTGTVSDFFKATATQYELIGTVPSSSVSLSFTNSAIAAIWPVTSTYSVSDVVAGTIKTNILLPSSGPFNGTSKLVATGTGTLQLPNGIILNDCLQLKTNFSGTGSVTIFTLAITVTITNVTYDYYHASQKYPVLSVNYSETAFKQGAGTPTITSNSAISVNTNVFVGISESTLNSNFSIYPNPANNNLNVMLTNSSSENVTVKIFNNIGQLVKTINLGNTKDINQQIDISDLSSGIYMVKTTIGTASASKKLIKD